MVQSLLPKVEERNHGESLTASACRHSGELEVLLALVTAVMVLNERDRREGAPGCIFELLQFEERKLSGNPQRVRYFLDLLQLVEIGVEGGIRNHGSDAFLFLDRFRAKWTTDGVEEAAKLSL